jgi:hypothetical protein
VTQPPPLESIPNQTPTLLSFRDRSTMLKVVGILFILAGALCGCLTAMTPLALIMPRPAGAPQQPVSTIVSGLAIYAALCAVLLTIGIGCVRKRRWVRPVIIVLSWIGLVGGIIGMIGWTVMAPQMGAAMRAATPPGTPAPPPAFVNIMIVVMSIFMAVIYVIIPSVLLWLFRGDDVRATLEHYDPTPRWTDGVPLPVLGLCALLALSVVWALMAAIQGWFLFMGVVLTGMAARVVALVVAGLFAATARLVFRRTMFGWTLALVLFLIMPIAWIVTLLRYDMIEIYRSMGMDESQLRVMASMWTSSSTLMAIVIGAAALATVIFTISVRKHFNADDDVPAPAPPM